MKALLSVSDKTGLLPFAKALTEKGIELISTGGTHKALQEAGIPVTGISDVTGFPEIMDGRVKTLHPKIHGGLLGVRTNPNHQAQMNENGIEAIDFVIVNLYPFKNTVANPNVKWEDAIENIDIGGPSMLRSAAKNHEAVTVVVDANDYNLVLAELNENGKTTLETRRKLAAKVFRHTAGYDALIADYLTKESGETYPESITLTFEKKQDLRYGENPHQSAGFYQAPFAQNATIPFSTQIQGKELSYNNINDADAALAIVKEFDAPAVVAVKHMNPCGVGTGETLLEATQRAYDADPVSIFGGIIATNREIEATVAQFLKPIFLEIIIAPSFSAEALKILSTKKNLRLLTVDLAGKPETALQYTSVQGGLLVQQADVLGFEDAEIRVVTVRTPTEKEWEDLKLAWKVVKHVKSNAIVVAKNQMTVGIGAGQMNRVGAAKIAFEQGGEKCQGAALGSDAFFPMADSVEAAAAAGITAIIQPGGSIKDQASVDVANAAGIAMVFTGLRHFKH